MGWLYNKRVMDSSAGIHEIAITFNVSYIN